MHGSWRLLHHSKVQTVIMVTHVLLWFGLFELVFGIGTQITVGRLGDISGTVHYTEWNNRTIFTFRGIPYAEPPVGDLRFRPPVQITSWNGTLNATSYGPGCPQESVSYDEDCLTLNVFVPETESSNDGTLLPVLIFIHGGTFISNSASMYKPLRFMDEKDLIVVVLQFRLGLLGLFSLQTDDVPGNVQFLDQIMAMQWVQDNIQYFGGDKNRVTLYGQSSGAASVHLHLLSPLTEGLFHRTILQSGSALRTNAVDNDPMGSAVILADYCGCPNTTDADKIAACMRALLVEEIVNCSVNYLNETIYDGLTRSRGHMAVIQTSGDLRFLTEDPKKLVENGKFLKLPMMGGVTKRDGAAHLTNMYDFIFHPRGLVNDVEYARYNLTAYVLKYLGVPDITSGVTHTMMKTYFTDDQIGDLVSMAPGLTDICSLITYKSGSYETLYANKVFQDTYLYTFNYHIYDPNSENPLYPFDISVTHSDDMRLLFSGYDYGRDDDVDMAKLLIQIWTSFVINGVPSAAGVTWPAMSTPVGPYLIIDSSPTVGENFLNEFITSGAASFTITTGPTHNLQYLTLIAVSLAGRKLY